jgi:MarR family transcriptional regulator, organic hydroperoxide resistance regulator
MFCLALYTATNAVQQTYRPLLDELGLTYPQYLALCVLWSSPSAPTVGSIGAALHLESSTLTPVLKRLEKAGLVTRHRDPNDERQVRIALTDTGRALADRAAHIPACIVERTGLSLEALNTLRRDLTRLNERLREETGR